MRQIHTHSKILEYLIGNSKQTLNQIKIRWQNANIQTHICRHTRIWKRKQNFKSFFQQIRILYDWTVWVGNFWLDCVHFMVLLYFVKFAYLITINIYVLFSRYDFDWYINATDECTNTHRLQDAKPIFSAQNMLESSIDERRATPTKVNFYLNLMIYTTLNETT